jgi:hypothetical protein
MSQSLRKALPRNITLSTAFLGPVDKLIKNLFKDIFHDYDQRFEGELSKERRHVSFCGVERRHVPEEQMATCVSTEKRMHIIVHDPSLDAVEDTEHEYVAMKFVEMLVHEIVHVMQALKDRDNVKIGKTLSIPLNGLCPTELYFFAPEEIEARTLEMFYFYTFGQELASFNVKKVKKKK